jgi:hypothetical protein
MWRLHRTPRWCGDAFLHDPHRPASAIITTIEAIGETPEGKVLQQAQLETRSGAIANPGSSCRPRRC